MIISKLKFIKIKIINRILAIIATICIGCSEKEILPCNLNTQNGIAYDINNRVYNGTCNYLIENEVLWKTITYKRGRLYKEIAYYTDNGGIEYIGFRDRDGNIDGEFKRYFKNGQLELEGMLKEGYRSGKWQIYNYKGDLIEEVEYDKKGNPITKN